MLSIFELNKDITSLSNFKTPAKTKYYFEINKISDIDIVPQITQFAEEKKFKVLFIWGWTNLLFWFDLFDWIIIKNNLKWWEYNENTKILETYSDESISDIAEVLFKDDIQQIWKRFIWLPWSVGWAIFWNAGCFWLETSNNFLEALVLNLKTWKQELLSKENMKFSYRTSIIKEKWDYFIIKARFDLSKKVEKYHSNEDNIYFREVRQPKWNTCWSFFKNPSKEFSAWKLIEEAWLKWYKLWWAYFSELHANFLMNDWIWNYKDLLNLIKIAQEKVKEKFSIDLVPEVRIITNK